MFSRKALALLLCALTTLAVLSGCQSQSKATNTKRVTSSINNENEISVDVPERWESKTEDSGYVTIRPTGDFDGMIQLGLYINPMSEFSNDEEVLNYLKEKDGQTTGDWKAVSYSDSNVPAYEIEVSYSEGKNSKGFLRALISGKYAISVEALAAEVDWAKAKPTYQEMLQSISLKNNELPSYRNSDPLNYELDTRLEYNGVTFGASKNWKASDTENEEYHVLVNSAPNAQIYVMTDTHGRMSTLDGAWKEFTNIKEPLSPAEAWESEGVTYQTGSWIGDDRWKHRAICGFENSTGKGFLLHVACDKDGWTDEQFAKLFDDIRGSLSYDPSKTEHDSKPWTPPATTSSVGSTGGAANPSTAASIYKAGTYKVGKDMPAGEYRLTSTDSSLAYWEVTDSSTADADIIGNDNFTGTAYVTVEEGQYLTLKRCTATPEE